MDKEKAICVRVLEGFKIAEKVEPDELMDFRSGLSQLYARGPIYIFRYKRNRYYIVNDYSIDDDPKFVKNILLERNHLLKGHLLKSPVHFTVAGSEYIYGLDGGQYFLWEEPRA